MIRVENCVVWNATVILAIYILFEYVMCDTVWDNITLFMLQKWGFVFSLAPFEECVAHHKSRVTRKIFIGYRCFCAVLITSAPLWNHISSQWGERKKRHTITIWMRYKRIFLRLNFSWISFLCWYCPKKRAIELWMTNDEKTAFESDPEKSSVCQSHSTRLCTRASHGWI